MTSHRFVVLALALTAGVSTAACRPREQKAEAVSAPQARRAPEAVPADVQAQIDSGNAAFSAGDHKTALEHYTRAKDLKGDVAAAWFGVYMAQHALGDEDAAAQALVQAQKLSPKATLLHPTATDSAR